jgi:hypothetical protein
MTTNKKKSANYYDFVNVKNKKKWTNKRGKKKSKHQGEPKIRS